VDFLLARENKAIGLAFDAGSSKEIAVSVGEVAQNDSLAGIGGNIHFCQRLLAN